MPKEIQHKISAAPAAPITPVLRKDGTKRRKNNSLNLD